MLLSAKLGLVSVPESESVRPFIEPGFDREEAGNLLRSLGQNLGMSLLTRQENVFPDAADPEKDAETISALSFPDEAVRGALENLDVVWMNGSDVVAAFVLEPGSGRHEGVRRLADLIALHPKLKTALYIVSLPSLKTSLLSEINRPVYRLLKKPVAEVVRILDWTRLESEVRELGERVRYLKAEFLEGISDVVEPPAME